MLIIDKFLHIIIAYKGAFPGGIDVLTSRIRTMEEIVRNKDCLYSVNNYQRFYVWNDNKVDTYLNDIWKVIGQYQAIPVIPKHFFGQFIMLKTEEDDRGRETFEVIDGQQRLTTFLLLIASIKGQARKISIEHPEVRTLADTIIQECNQYLFSEKEGAPRKNKFTLSVRDNEYFSEIINYLSANRTVIERNRYISHIHLFRAQLRIKYWLVNLLSEYETPAGQVDVLIRLRNTASEAFQIVVLKPNSPKFTYRLYQVVNDRGEPLKDSELLKAKSIEILDSSPDFLSEAQRIWDDILSDSGKDTDNYLKWCYLSKMGQEWKQDRLYRAYVEEYFATPDNTILTEEQKNIFLISLQNLHADIIVCRKIASGIWPYENSTLQEWQRNVLKNLVVGMRHTLCIPLLLSAYRQPAIHGVSSEENFYKCLELCENFFILIKGLFKMREDKLKKRYYSAAVSMREHADTYRSSDFKNELIQIEPALIRRECEQKLKDITYNTKSDNPAMKYLCILLETYWRCFDSDGRIVIGRVPNGTSLIYTELSLEHIYPKTAKATHIDANLEPHKNKLGNIFVFGNGDNSGLENRPYEQKREVYRTSRFVSANDVALTNEHWTIAEFQNRHNDVCDKLSRLLLRFYR